jgi:glycosyltransferase involved in cell wall biosynthesis
VRILFHEPPADRRIGGIETALTGLTDALSHLGLDVTRASDVSAEQIAAADVVHFHGLWEPSHVRSRRWCRKQKKPFVVSPHGMLEDWAFQHRGWKKYPYFYLLEKNSIATADIILATSETETIPLRRWFDPAKIRILPLGCNASAPSPSPSDRMLLRSADGEFVILFLSRCHPKKGLHLLIEALPRAVANGPAVHLVIVGDGERAYVEPLQRATATWSRGLRCTWAGAIWGDEKWRYFGAADLFCLPSYSENFGLAVLEALFAGTPVLTTEATPWASLRDSLPVHLIRSGEADLIPALTARLSSPAPTEAERASTRSAARARFSWPALAPRYADLYRQLLQP